MFKMFYCGVVTLLIINAFCVSSGASLPVVNNNGSLGSALTALANRCGNEFLSSQIKSKVAECNVTLKPLNDREFQCLIFYDINTQLCDAVAESKLGIAKEQQPKLSLKYPIEQFCNASKDYKVTLPDFAEHKSVVEGVFSIFFMCLKACGSEEILSQDTNYYCKYYKWGRDLLETTHRVPTSLSNHPAISDGTVKIETAGSQHKSVVPSVIAPISMHNITQPQLKEDPLSDSDIKVRVSGVPAPETSNANLNKAIESQSTTGAQQSGGMNPDLPVEQEDANVGESPQKLISANPSDLGNIDRPSAPVEETKDEIKIEDGNNPLSGQDLVPDEKKKPVNDPDEYQDNVGDSEGLDDIQGRDDGDDPVQANDLDQNKPDNNDQNKIPEKRLETGFDGEREFINVLPDGYADNDDYFFPYFMIMIVVMVALYILYHNKNRLTKMFFGLVVEGRQGRRRNSRGHAYRRLDTLEQAMSANTAAPPSKIIY